ncbi:PQQ-binding-like beta-propeller repeat protein [Streptomyces sp. NBC_00233]|uniref:outer membrane protein assembly factor BamB family protein n=1 Tax=Streptomyces sp. NBC_00233 TaxID=2975686 RepID=UPI00225B72A0|nr:PQQ-binding-like beta-propeller repeat protein [Streptomyces sp. NBC_00233]MCX5232635.1 PQQ-like beta-propeller repeat protein [Streptomyces sp. NBC_00233]
MTTRVNDMPSGRRSARRTLATAAALIALCWLTTGCGLLGSGNETMSVVWDTPADRKAEPHGMGAWLSGDTLVRSRFDAVTGFDAATGERSWEYVPPGRSSVCHATADTARSVLVLVRDGDGAASGVKDKSCTTAVGIDMKDGRELWQAPLSEPEPPRFQDYSVSAGAGVAVLLQQDELRAVDVRTGKPRWKAALPKGCVPGRTAAAERQVAAFLACGGEDDLWEEKVAEDAELHTAAFDPATGALRWSAPLGGRRAIGYDAFASFVSAYPVVVAASESGDGERGSYFSFGRDGRPNPPIDFSGPYGKIGYHSLTMAAADDRRLYAMPEPPTKRSRDSRYHLTAFDLATGAPVWGGTPDDDRLDGDSGYRLLVQDGTLTVLTSHRKNPSRVRVLDPATGEQREIRDLPDDVDSVDKIFAYKGRLVVARYAAYETGSRPFTAYERR